MFRSSKVASFTMRSSPPVSIPQCLSWKEPATVVKNFKRKRIARIWCGSLQSTSSVSRFQLSPDRSADRILTNRRSGSATMKLLTNRRSGSATMKLLTNRRSGSATMKLLTNRRSGSATMKLLTNRRSGSATMKLLTNRRSGSATMANLDC